MIVCVWSNLSALVGKCLGVICFALFVSFSLLRPEPKLRRLFGASLEGTLTTQRRTK